MRRVVGLGVAVIISACGGDESRNLAPLPEFANMHAYGLTPAPGGIYLMRKMLGPAEAMRVTGTTVTAIANATDGSFQSNPDGKAIYTKQREILAIEGTAAVPFATFVDPIVWSAVDAAGGVYVVNNSLLEYRAPGAAAFAPVQSSVTQHSFAQGATHASDGSVWAVNTVVNMQGAVRIEPSGATMPFSCTSTPELMTSCDVVFPIRGGAGAPVMYSNGTFYEIRGTQLVPIAMRREDAMYVSYFTRGGDGKLYIVAAADNRSVTNEFLYVLDGDDWTQLVQIPDGSEAAVTKDGTIYVGATTALGGTGGLYIVR